MSLRRREKESTLDKLTGRKSFDEEASAEFATVESETSHQQNQQSQGLNAQSQQPQQQGNQQGQQQNQQQGTQQYQQSQQNYQQPMNQQGQQGQGQTLNQKYYQGLNSQLQQNQGMQGQNFGSQMSSSQVGGQSQQSTLAQFPQMLGKLKQEAQQQQVQTDQEVSRALQTAMQELTRAQHLIKNNQIYNQLNQVIEQSNQQLQSEIGQLGQMNQTQMNQQSQQPNQQQNQQYQQNQ